MDYVFAFWFYLEDYLEWIGLQEYMEIMLNIDLFFI